MQSLLVSVFSTLSFINYIRKVLKINGLQCGKVLNAISCDFLFVSAQNIISDSGKSRPDIDIVHLCYDGWPTGIGVSAGGRKLANYPPALDTHDQIYTVAELTPNSAEMPYPNAKIENPPSGRINHTTTPTDFTYHNHVIGFQSVVTGQANRLRILDTGRALPHDDSKVLSSALC